MDADEITVSTLVGSSKTTLRRRPDDAVALGRVGPRKAALRPGSPAPAMGPGTVMKVSGPVPKENVALEIVVAAVTPERWRVKVAGPST
jgi:hypothetical protein